MKLTLPITPQSTSPLREAFVFAGLVIAVTWLFWLPGAFLPMDSLIGNLLLAVGCLVPLAVAVFLEIWLQEHSLAPLTWLRNLSWQSIHIAALLPIMLFCPLLLLRYYQGTLEGAKFLTDARTAWLSLFGLGVLGIAQQVGWRAYLLPRLRNVPSGVTNLLVGLLWFLNQLPLVLAGRYNESENFGAFFIAMFLYALLITPFYNRLAWRAGFNPILPGVMQAGLAFLTDVYFRQGRADPLTDTFGLLTLAWLVVLNVILFSQLWQGKKPPAQISELERVMPLEIV